MLAVTVLYYKYTSYILVYIISLRKIIEVHVVLKDGSSNGSSIIVKVIGGFSRRIAVIDSYNSR